MKKTILSSAVSLIVAVFMGFAAQAQTQAANTDSNQSAKTQQADMQNKETLNDAQIAGIVKVVNESEIQAAKMAEKKAQNDQVKEFAKMMVDEHKKNGKDEKDLAKKVDIKRDEKNEIVKQMKEDSKNKMAALKKLKDNEFDQIYIDQQVTMHQQALNDLDHKLIPSAQDAQLKGFLKTTRDHVAMHLEKAKSIQDTLTK